MTELVKSTQCPKCNDYKKEKNIINQLQDLLERDDEIIEMERDNEIIEMTISFRNNLISRIRIELLEKTKMNKWW